MLEPGVVVGEFGDAHHLAHAPAHQGEALGLLPGQAAPAVAVDPPLGPHDGGGQDVQVVLVGDPVTAVDAVEMPHGGSAVLGFEALAHHLVGDQHGVVVPLAARALELLGVVQESGDARDAVVPEERDGQTLEVVPRELVLGDPPEDLLVVLPRVHEFDAAQPGVAAHGHSPVAVRHSR